VTARIIDGKAIADKIQAEVAKQAAELREQTGVVPQLVAILIGDDSASASYVRGKKRACEQAGMKSTVHTLPASTSEQELLALVAQCNADPDIHGILVQLPLPKQIRTQRVLDAVSPLKDVDAFHPENVGLIVQGRPRFLPCTPHGVQRLLLETNTQIAGSEVVVLGRSEIVGKPMALMLLQKGVGADATVTVCHSRTRNLPGVTRRADILIAAIGSPKFVTVDMVKPGAVVIDVGINRVADTLVGDVEFEAVRQVASAITPVPGGVGKMTIAMLLANTLKAARLSISADREG
jgi:methylenetetrahydrofolate dehydrogenase (NADP+) / methenyltetrahydrofolate cyclohydrolase